MALPIVHLHRPEMMAVTFDRGAYRSLKTGARIEYERSNLDEDSGFGGDFRNPLILDRSIKLLMDPPYNFLPFSTLDNQGKAAEATEATVGNSECPFSNLVLVDMQAKMVGGDKVNNIVDVEMTYQHVMDGHNQILINPPSGRLFVKGRSNIVDKTTNFYRKDGNPAAPKEQLFVAHTYPETDLDISASAFEASLPRTHIQTGEINIPFPSKGFTLQGMIFTDDIVSIANDLVAHINTEPLFGDVPIEGFGHWICSEFAWEMHSAFHASWQNNVGSYKVSMEFQFNFDTWGTDVIFLDKRTGQPPANVKKATIADGSGVFRLVNHPSLPAIQPAGVWRVPSLPKRNFTLYFGNVAWEAIG